MASCTPTPSGTALLASFMLTSRYPAQDYCAYPSPTLPQPPRPLTPSTPHKPPLPLLLCLSASSPSCLPPIYTSACHPCIVLCKAIVYTCHYSTRLPPHRLKAEVIAQGLHLSLCPGVPTTCFLLYCASVCRSCTTWHGVTIVCCLV